MTKSLKNQHHSVLSIQPGFSLGPILLWHDNWIFTVAPSQHQLTNKDLYPLCMHRDSLVGSCKILITGYSYHMRATVTGGFIRKRFYFYNFLSTSP